MHYLITGGAGFIGSNFIRHLFHHQTDAVITNLDKLTYCGNPANLAEFSTHPRYHFIQADICDYDQVDQAMQDVDIVINFAADTHVDRSVNFDGAPFIQTDVYGIYVLLTAMRNHPRITRFHQISTDEVYGDIPVGRYATERDGLCGSSPYAASKAGGDLQALAFARTYQLPVTISRATNNYGAYQYPEKLIPLFITNALESKPLPLYDGGTQIRDWLHVDDHCRAIKLILDKGIPGEIYNIGANQSPEITNLELTRRIIEFTGLSPDQIHPVQGLRPGHDQRYAVDTSKIRSLGWSPRISFQDGLYQTIQWYREHPEWWKPLKSGEFLHYYQKHYRMEL
ncbi:MAG: dTDP-glucose 4,6-dehydratase [Candidatus Delongbacteria bacterium]|nr:dTDP-glucose 4,6-dehydratase [Candidatus Delongbacteria bacterium]